MSDVTTPAEDPLASTPRTAEGPRQTVILEPPDRDIGPHFPSGMSTVEAALAGATAGMSDADIAKVRGEAGPGDPIGGPAIGPSGTAVGEGEVPEAPAEGEEFDPSGYTIDQVLAYVDANPDEVDSVLAAEEAGKARSTLITQLEARQA
jgi:hypothetical protein